MSTHDKRQYYISVYSYLKTINQTVMNVARLVVVKGVVCHCTLSSKLRIILWCAILYFTGPWFSSCNPWNYDSLSIIVTLSDMHLNQKNDAVNIAGREEYSTTAVVFKKGRKKTYCPAQNEIMSILHAIHNLIDFL